VTWGKRLYFSSEGRHAEDFFAGKNPKKKTPQTWVPEASMLTTRPPKSLSLRKLQSLRKCHNENISNAAYSAIILAYATDEQTVYWKRKRSIWTQEWLKRRSVIRHGNLINELELSSMMNW
jgi:hypothetical protein